MARSFRGGKALHDLAENAPVQALLGFLAHHDIELAPDADNEDGQRKQILESLRDLDVDHILRAKDTAPRIVPFGEKRNGWIISRSVEKRLAEEQREEFEAGDELGRAIWAFLHCRAAFDDAEAILHAVNQRSWAKSYSSFEVAGGGRSRFIWSDDAEATLRSRIVELLPVPWTRR